jgi:hypothetical protein
LEDVVKPQRTDGIRKLLHRSVVDVFPSRSLRVDRQVSMLDMAIDALLKLPTHDWQMRQHHILNRVEICVNVICGGEVVPAWIEVSLHIFDVLQSLKVLLV